MNSEFYDKEKVSRIIGQYCFENGITEAEFASLINVHPAHLPRVKSGRMSSFTVLCKIALLGRTQLHELFNEIPERFKHELRDTGRAKNIPVCL